MKKKSAITARLYQSTPRDLARLAQALRRGELVAVPTETVYGLAANALDARACRRIFTAKGRPTTDPLIVHLHDRRDLTRVAHPNPAALLLARKFWPGPLTMVLPKKSAVPAIVSAGLSSVAVRMPRHPLFRRLLKLSGLVLAAPSANPFGYVSPTTAEHVRAGLGKKIHYILDGGPSVIGLESTIVDLRDPAHPRLLRPGAITRKQVERVLGCRVTMTSVKNTRPTARGAQLAPGLLKQHYSPRTPVVLHPRLTLKQVRASRKDEAWLFLAKPRGTFGSHVRWLDARGNLRGVARGLFNALRVLDDGRFRKIHVELARGDGLADAINDRLYRAAAR